MSNVILYASSFLLGGSCSFFLCFFGRAECKNVWDMCVVNFGFIGVKIFDEELLNGKDHILEISMIFFGINYGN